MASTSTDRRFGVNAGQALKVPVHAATTATITHSGEQTIDGTACVTGDRVLDKNNTNAALRGIWVVDTGAWVQSTDFDDVLDVCEGTLIPVNQGTINGGTMWRVTTTGTITPGTTSLTFEQTPFGSFNTYLPISGGTVTGDVRFDGKVGVGAAGSTWTTYKGVDVLDRTALVDAGTSRTSYIAQNAYYDGANWRSKGAGAGYLYAAGSLATPGGQPGHGWFSSTTSPVGGGDIFTFAQKMGLSNYKLDLIGVALNYAAPLTVASAATTPIGADNSAYASNNITISGTTTITSLGTIAAGIQRDVTFSGALVLTHNATSLILPTAASITTAAGDTAKFQSLGSGNWKCLNYQRASGQPLIPSVGVGQTWKIVTRTSGSTYTNSTGRTIMVMGQATTASSGAQIFGTCNNVDLGTSGGANVAAATCTFLVPPGADYKLTASLGTLDGAWELS